MEAKDSLIIKTTYSKKSPALLRMVVLLFTMVCGMYIFSICIKQTKYFKDSYFLNIIEFNEPCQTSGINKNELPYLHFPRPKSFKREECACNPVRYFAIISMQRSGSGWFETLLNSHENVSSNGEIFGAKYRRSNVSMLYETLDRVYNLDWFSSASKNECSAAVGFKWMLNQGLMEYHTEIAEYFKERGVQAIFLFRRNHLRRMISLLANNHDKNVKVLNGTHKSHVHSPHEAKVLANYKPTINATFLVSDLKSAERKTARVLEYFKNTRNIVLYYEDMVRNKTKLVDVQEFLKLPHRNLTSNQVKIHTASLLSHIENWEEVQTTLKGTKYESYLQADY